MVIANQKAKREKRERKRNDKWEEYKAKDKKIAFCTCIRKVSQPNFEDIEIESIWLKIRPYRLPRGTSSVLVAAVYHPPSSVADQNSMLIAHLQKNIENFLASYPQRMVILIQRLLELNHLTLLWQQDCGR